MQERVGLRQQAILEVDEGGVANASERDHDAWQRAREGLVERGATPSLEVASVTAASETLAAAGAPAPEVPIDRVERDPDRPHGRRFGTLVHAILAVAPLDADPEALDETALLHARCLGASAQECEAAAACVRAALAHPLLRRAAVAADLRRETAVWWPRAEGGFGEGIVDLAFREEADDGARWTVVDFKTDRDLGERAGRYATQVQLYAEAIAAATGEPAEARLLLV